MSRRIENSLRRPGAVSAYSCNTLVSFVCEGRKDGRKSMNSLNGRSKHPQIAIRGDWVTGASGREQNGKIH